MTISGEQVLGRSYPELHGPVVNLNGAERGQLLEQHVAVMRVARELLETIGRALPHGRDYQTAQFPVSYTHDRMVVEGMLQDIANIQRQYERIAERLVVERDS